MVSTRLNRSAVRSTLGAFLTGVVLAACATGEPSEPDEPAATSVVPTSTDSSEAATATPTEAAVAAACAEYEAIFRETSGSFEDVGLGEGVVLSDDQLAALQSIVDGYVAVEIEDTELRALANGVVGIAELMIDRAGEPLTAAEWGSLSRRLSLLATTCEERS